MTSNADASEGWRCNHLYNVLNQSKNKIAADLMWISGQLDSIKYTLRVHLQQLDTINNKSSESPYNISTSSLFLSQNLTKVQPINNLRLLKALKASRANKIRTRNYFLSERSDNQIKQLPMEACKKIFRE